MLPDVFVLERERRPLFCELDSPGSLLRILATRRSSNQKLAEDSGWGVGSSSTSRHVDEEHAALSYLSGYSSMVREVVQTKGNGEIILFDGSGAGNFIFNMRIADPGRRFVVLTKGLYATRIMERFGAVELVHDTKELQDLISAYGIRHIVVTDQSSFAFPIQQTLRDYLKGPQFRLIATVPVVTNFRTPVVYNLLLYENRAVSRPAATSIDLKMLTLSHDIDVPLRELGIN
jgi:hypothetical protein